MVPNIEVKDADGKLLHTYEIHADGYGTLITNEHTSLAREYLIISHNRLEGDVVLLVWLAPLLFSTEATSSETKKALSRNLVIGIAHLILNETGDLEFRLINAPKLKTLSGLSIDALERKKILPRAEEFVEFFQKTSKNAFGKFGEGIKWFYYDGGNVANCREGGFIVSFLGTDYDYKTPIPGCPS